MLYDCFIGSCQSGCPEGARRKPSVPFGSRLPSCPHTYLLPFIFPSRVPCAKYKHITYFFLFYSRCNLAMIQPELFLAELATEEPSAKGSTVQRTMRERVSPLFRIVPARHTAHTERFQQPPNLTLQKPEQTDDFSLSIYKDAERFWLLWQLHEAFHAIVVTAVNL